MILLFIQISTNFIYDLFSKILQDLSMFNFFSIFAP